MFSLKIKTFRDFHQQPYLIAFINFVVAWTFNVVCTSIWEVSVAFSVKLMSFLRSVFLWSQILIS